MNPQLTDFEREALQNFNRDGGLVKSAMVKFVIQRTASLESSAASALRTMPRQLELAADYASRADEVRVFLAELERYSERP
jgi:hypothetical protein